MMKVLITQEKHFFYDTNTPHKNLQSFMKLNKGFTFICSSSLPFTVVSNKIKVHKKLYRFVLLSLAVV